MSSVSLTASVRTSLSALKTTSGQLSTTTDRLSTGKKVASAIDNPTNFFAAENYKSRADSLESRLDSMGEATQMINAADNGITSIKAYLSQMKGVVNNALSNTDSDQRAEYGKQFNELITQIQDIAADSSYGGINLIQGNASTTVQFGQNIGDSDIKLQGFNISSANAELDANGELGSSAVADSNGKSYALTLDVNGSDVIGIQSAGSNGAGGANADLTAVYNKLLGFTLSTSTTYSQLQTLLSDSDLLSALDGYLSDITGKTVSSSYDSASGIDITYDSTTYSAGGGSSNMTALYTAVIADAGYPDDNNNAPYDLIVALNQLSLSNQTTNSGGTVSSSRAMTYNTQVSELGTHLSSGGWSVDWSGTNYQTDLKDVIGQIEDVESSLQTQSSKLANNLAIITTREDYTQSSIDILNNGADDLTLADLNEEGADLLSLQTSQSLAVQALSLSSSSAGNVLSILR